jgi:hypothetical protein
MFDGVLFDQICSLSEVTVKYVVFYVRMQRHLPHVLKQKRRSMTGFPSGSAVEGANQFFYYRPRDMSKISWK